MALGRRLVIGSAILGAIFAASAGGPVHSEEKPQVIAKADAPASAAPAAATTALAPNPQQAEASRAAVQEEKRIFKFEGDVGLLTSEAQAASINKGVLAIAMYVGKQNIDRAPQLAQKIVNGFKGAGIDSEVHYTELGDGDGAAFKICIEGLPLAKVDKNERVVYKPGTRTAETTYTWSELRGGFDRFVREYKARRVEASAKAGNLVASVPRPDTGD